MSKRIWYSRILIGVVFAMNIQCGLAFIITPGRYLASFDLNGIPGEAAIRGFGLLFLMWNIPYGIALYHPVRYRISLYEAIAMQVLGVAGESVILYSIDLGYANLTRSITRFILFDTIGLIALMAAALLTSKQYLDRPET